MGGKQTGSALEILDTHPSLLRRFLVVMLIVSLNLFLLETVSRLIVIHAKPTQGKTATYDLKFQMADKRYPRRPDLLLLGDSIAFFGLYPEWLDARLAQKGAPGLVSLNLASPSATPEMNLLLLKREVAKNGPPRLLVYNFSPRVFNLALSEDEYDADFPKSYLARCHSGKPLPLGGALQCQLEEHLALARYRAFLRNELIEKLGNTYFDFNDRLEFPLGKSTEREVSEGGWAPAYTVQTDASLRREYGANAKVEKVFREELGHYRWGMDRFQPLLAYCQSRHIPVLLVWLPESPLIDPYYRRIGLSRKLLADHLQSEAQTGAFGFLDLSHDALDAGQFADLDHLNASGAMTVSSKLADRLLQPPFRALFLKKAVPSEKNPDAEHAAR